MPPPTSRLRAGPASSTVAATLSTWPALVTPSVDALELRLHKHARLRTPRPNLKSAARKGFRVRVSAPAPHDLSATARSTNLEDAGPRPQRPAGWTTAGSSGPRRP